MGFKLQTLLAALALTVATAPAQAAFNNNFSGNGSLFLTVLDNTNNISALFDLGYENQTFNSGLVADALANGGTYTWNLAAGDYASAWSTFWATAVNSSSLQWGVMSADNTGGSAGARNLITTYNSGVKFVSTTQMQSTLTNFDAYLNANATLGNHASVANGASTATAGAAFAEDSKAYGTTGRINATGYDTTATLGTTMTLRQVFQGASAAAAVTESTLSNANGNFGMNLSSAGVLTFTAPVPEADTNAMLMVGLGMIGFMARRRKVA
jgi:PEP-CTERM motif